MMQIKGMAGWDVEAYTFSPKNCIRRNLVSLVLLLRKACTSLMPWKARATIAMEMTVDPEELSMTVVVLPFSMPFSNRFMAISCLAPLPVNR